MSYFTIYGTQIGIPEEYLSTEAQAQQICAEIGGVKIQEAPAHKNEFFTWTDARRRYEVVLPNGDAANAGFLLSRKTPYGHWAGLPNKPEWVVDPPPAAPPVVPPPTSVPTIFTGVATANEYYTRVERKIDAIIAFFRISV